MRTVTLRSARWLLLALLLAPTTARAQNSAHPAPRLSAVTPAGGKVGTTVEIVLGGADLDDVSSLLFSDPNLKAERVPDPPPPKKDPKKPAKPAPPRPPTFRVTIPANATAGLCDVRAVGKWGVSNPRAFVVGTLAEMTEKEPNDDVPQAQRVPLESVVNGVIANKVDVDYFTFTGKKGQRVVIHAAASSIDSRLYAHLQLYDAAGRLLDSNKNYRDRDAVVDCVLPADGDYQVRLCEFAYQNGGPESFYRLTLTTGPWIDAAFPPVLEPGKTAEVTLYGKNLPGGKALSDAGPNAAPLEALAVKITPPPPGDHLAFRARLLPRVASLDGFEYRFGAPGANPVLLGWAAAPIVIDNGANDTHPTAQAVPVPCEICGRVERRGDRDYYTIEGKKGDILILEGFADRLRAPTDLVMQLRRADKGTLIGEYDDHTALPSVVDRLFTYTDDPRARFAVPEDGKYELLVRSRYAETQFGPRHVYRVSVRRERPDFRLALVGNHDSGAGLTLRRGGNHDLNVVCFRRDGFEGEVLLEARGLPAGITCMPQTLGPKLRQGSLVLTAAAGAADWTGPFSVTGTAIINGAKVVHEARACCFVFPAPNGNVPAVSRLAHSLCLAVREKGPFRLDVPSAEMAVPIGGSLQLKVKVQKQDSGIQGNVQVDLAAGPAQANGNPINSPKINVAADKEGSLKLQIPGNAPTGTYNLVARGVGKVQMVEGPKKKKKTVNFTAASAPIRLTIYDTVTELALGAADVRVAPGGERGVPIKLKRLHKYAGPLAVELIVPSGFQGVSAAKLTVPPGKNDAVLVLKCAKGAKPAASPAFLVRVTAKVGNQTLKQEAKLRLAIDPKQTAGPATKPGTPATKINEVALLPASAAGWRYSAQVKGDAWRTPDFDDKTWKTIKAPFGNGETEITARKGTEIPEKGQTLYARRAFDVPANVLSSKGLTLRLLLASDDSAIVYLNGKLVDREDGDHEYRYWNRDVTLPTTALRAGRNVLAVQVVNTAGSSDVYLDAALIAEVPARAAKK